MKRKKIRTNKPLEINRETLAHLEVRGGLQSAGGNGSPCDTVCSCSNPTVAGNSCS